MCALQRTTTLVAALAMMMLSGCGETTAPAGEVTLAPEPSQVMRNPFANCAWGEVQGATMSIWSYDCGADNRLVADNDLPGFVFPGGRVAVRAFPKDPAAPATSILAQVRAASPGPHTDTCELVSTPDAEYTAREYYQFQPTGAAKAEWEASQEPYPPPAAQNVEPPCGAMGPQYSGDRSFTVPPGHPEMVVFVEYGSELQIFDIETLTVRGAD